MPSAADRPSWLHLAALFGLSAATLAFEILLLRLFEFSHWHYFAGFAIALALLGLGSAGTTLALLGSRPERWGDGWFLGGLLTAALGLYIVLGLQAGQPSQPIVQKNGVGVIMMCEKAAPPSAPTAPSRDDIAETLMRQRLDTLARRYMRDLRRTAFVDVRV